MITSGQAKNHELLIREYIRSCHGDTLCPLQIWYEALEGCGVPDDMDLQFIRQVLESTGKWSEAGILRFEKFGSQPSYSREITPDHFFDDLGHIRIQHMFKAGAKYQAPDGKLYKLVLCEVYNLRCFEIKEGKFTGPMLRIHPTSKLAQSLVIYKG